MTAIARATKTVTRFERKKDSLMIFLRMWIGVRRVLSPGKHVARILFPSSANMSMKAVAIHEYGDSSKLSYEDVPIPEPGPGEVSFLAHKY